MPQGDRLKKVIERFRNIGHGFLQIGGAVDGAHIPIKSSPLNPACYINRKGFHSIQCALNFLGILCYWFALSGSSIVVLSEFVMH